MESLYFTLADYLHSLRARTFIKLLQVLKLKFSKELLNKVDHRLGELAQIVLIEQLCFRLLQVPS